MSNVRELEILHVGHKGDGVAEIDDDLIYVPFTLPGERVRAEISDGRGKLLDVVVSSEDRVTPSCVHFGVCGGCALQHFARDAYLEWKRAQVASALRARDIHFDISPIISVGSHQRRRAVFSANRLGGRVVFGFYEGLSHNIVDVSECPVVVPEIVDALPVLRQLSEALLTGGGSLRMIVLACFNGLDVSVVLQEGSGATLKSSGLFDAFAGARIVRLSVDGELVYSQGVPLLTIDRVAVTPPPGGFVQAARAAEQHLAKLMIDALPKGTRRIADLFCGLGSFTFPLARFAHVLAIDSDADLIAALQKANSHAQGLKPIEMRVRDLMHDPLSRAELKDFDVVVFDPPRAGARAQVEAIAKSQVSTVVAVSCNHATFARDARTLLNGGYSLKKVVPIDQFVFAPDVEVFAVFRA